MTTPIEKLSNDYIDDRNTTKLFPSAHANYAKPHASNCQPEPPKATGQSVCPAQDTSDQPKSAETEGEDGRDGSDTHKTHIGDDDDSQRVSVHVPEFDAMRREMAGNLESWVDLANEYFDIAPEYRDLGALYAAVTHSFRYCVRLGEKREEDAKLDLWPRIPYLAINAPTEGAGKSNLALLMEFTVMNAIRGSGSTSATIVRDCGARWPLTLITDDVDSQNDADPARWASICSLSNLGFKYDTRGVQEKVTLGAGKEKRTEMVTKYFSVFYPKIFSGIKLKDHLPRPTWSRCLSINMQVSSMASNFERDEPRIKIRGHKLRGRMAQLARRFNTMAGSIIAEDVPELANNPRMARQLAPPLLSVAMLAGSDWEARAAKALIYVDANTPKRIDTNRLLVCDLWERGFAKYSERLNPRFLLSTDGAISHLIEMNGRPWATWHKGRPISPQSLSDQLAEWQCAPSRHYDVDGRRKRGLLSSAVKAAYDRASKGMDLDDGDVEHRE